MFLLSTQKELQEKIIADSNYRVVQRYKKVHLIVGSDKFGEDPNQEPVELKFNITIDFQLISEEKADNANLKLEVN